MPTEMGIWSLDNFVMKRAFRWLFSIENIVGKPEANSVNVKPPLKSQRPTLTFKEITLEHKSETITMPGKAEWKPINLTLYDIAAYSLFNGACRKIDNNVWRWINMFYFPNQAEYGFAANPNPQLSFKKPAFLTMLDGGGSVLEQWRFENAWCQDVNFGELDMSSSDIMTIDITLRYDRAYIVAPYF
jgi:hypothetical protein